MAEVTADALAMWSRLYDTDAVGFYFTVPIGLRRQVFEWRRQRKVAA